MEIKQIEYDSRLVKPNSLFFAVRGFNQDGYDFVADAVSNGAIAVMGERKECKDVTTHVTVSNIRKAMAHTSACFYGFPGLNLKVCGVTGTNGKTSTCHMIKEILQARGKKVGIVTSLGYDTGSETFPAERTTPESIDLQRLLYLMKSNHCVNAVIEVSSHALSLHRVDQINFRVAVFTNLSRDHLDFHKDMDAYLKTKTKLLDQLDGPLSYAVINLDVPEFRSMFGEFKSAYISYSLEDESADVYCKSFELKPDKTFFDLHTPMGLHTVVLNLAGRFNLQNAIAAAAAGLASGIDVDNVVKGLEAMRPVNGRFSAVRAGQPFAVYVDFAHTPEALQRLCETARELSQGRVLLLFGCGGDRDTGKRKQMGEIASRLSDYAVVTSDNPRSEDPSKIIKKIKSGMTGKEYEVEPDRRAAIINIIGKASPGDVVLLAGKGSEAYQEIKGERKPFDDFVEARSALAALGFSNSGETEVN